MNSSPTLAPSMTMEEVLRTLPGARRALFRKYHIGGCSSCSFQPSETLQELCKRNDDLDVSEVIEHILTCHDQDQAMMLPPANLKKLFDDKSDLLLLDIRSREEHDAVTLKDSTFLTQENMRQLMSDTPKEKLLVFFDHDGAHVLDAASFFQGHGFTNVKCLLGGIDAWAVEVDPNMPRYRLE